jgi:hypothetical protein
MRSGCSGLRDRTEFVPQSALGERHLRSDFHFLEDVLQVKQRAKRTLAQSDGAGAGAGAGAGRGKRAKNGKFGANSNNGGGGSSGDGDGGGGSSIGIGGGGGGLDVLSQDLSQYPKAAKSLVDAARSRGTRVVLVPPGMSKRKQNTSHVKDRAIFWKVHVAFLDVGFTLPSLFRVDLDVKKAGCLESRGTGVLGAALERVNESTTLTQILEGFLESSAENAPNRHALRSIRLQRMQLQCLMHHHPSPSGNPLFCEVRTGKWGMRNGEWLT